MRLPAEATALINGIYVAQRHITVHTLMQTAMQCFYCIRSQCLAAPYFATAAGLTGGVLECSLGSSLPKAAYCIFAVVGTNPNARHWTMHTLHQDTLTSGCQLGINWGPAHSTGDVTHRLVPFQLLLQLHILSIAEDQLLVALCGQTSQHIQLLCLLLQPCCLLLHNSVQLPLFLPRGLLQFQCRLCAC